MSLNRREQQLFDYIEKNPEERKHCLHKVQTIAAECGIVHDAAVKLEGELWQYYRERVDVVPALREETLREGIARTSMRNLAEYLLRIWVEPAKKNRSERPGKSLARF